ncbi:MAG: hypothetical protein K5765_07335 [Clostridia bacterium]|nr:hypothetical protein [Clostridia bacterium]
MKIDKSFIKRNKYFMIASIVMVIFLIAFILCITLIPVLNNKKFERVYSQSEPDTTTEEYMDAKQNFIYSFNHYFDDVTSIQVSKYINLSTIFDTNVNDVLESMKVSKFDSSKIENISKALNENKITGVVSNLDSLSNITSIESFINTYSSYFALSYSSIFKVISKVVSNSNLSVNDLTLMIYNLAKNSNNEKVRTSINNLGKDQFCKFISTFLYYIRQMYGDLNLKEMNESTAGLIMELIYQIENIFTSNINQIDMENALHLFVKDSVFGNNTVLKNEVNEISGKTFEILKVLGYIAKNIQKSDIYLYSEYINNPNDYEISFNFAKTMISRIKEGLQELKTITGDTRFDSINNYVNNLVNIASIYDTINVNINMRAESMTSFNTKMSAFKTAINFFESHENYTDDLALDTATYVYNFTYITEILADLIIKPLEINLMNYVVGSLT